MLTEGTIDMALVAPEDIVSLKKDGFTIDGPRYVVETTIRFFMSYDPGILTSNKEFRKALILGMDLSAIMNSIYPPKAAALVGGSPMFGPLTEGYDPELSPYPHDPQKAIELLRESGYSGETVHLLSIPTYDLTEMPLVNEMIADDWRWIGLEVKTVSFNTYGPVKILYLERPQQFVDYLPVPVFSGGHVNRPGLAMEPTLPQARAAR